MSFICFTSIEGPECEQNTERQFSLKEKIYILNVELKVLVNRKSARGGDKENKKKWETSKKPIVVENRRQTRYKGEVIQADKAGVQFVTTTPAEQLPASLNLPPSPPPLSLCTHGCKFLFYPHFQFFFFCFFQPSQHIATVARIIFCRL